MTIRQYMKENHETYRTLAEKLGISHTYLCNIANGWNTYISEGLAETIKSVCPEIDIYEKVEIKYYLRG